MHGTLAPVREAKLISRADDSEIGIYPNSSGVTPLSIRRLYLEWSTKLQIGRLTDHSRQDTIPEVCFPSNPGVQQLKETPNLADGPI